MDNSEINDLRGDSAFKGISFSKFKKTEVKKELLNSLIHSKIEPACYWSAELICAGHFTDVWEVILLFFSKYVHLSNTNISIYLDMRINDFKGIVHNGYSDLILGLRNNDKVRKLFCEVMCVLCDAKRRHSFDNVKIKQDDMNMLTIKDKFKAPSTLYGEEVFTTEDPKELFPFVNELAYSVTESGNNQMHACYWIEWIIEYENRCKALKEKIFCERRRFVSSIDTKCQKDIVWIIWDVLLNESSKRSKLIQKVMDALLSLFSLKYTTGCHKKRKNLMYLGISLLCETFVIEKEIIRHSQTGLVTIIKQKIDTVYAQIKKNEESTGTDYLFMGFNANHLQNTIQKLEAMNSFGETFVPRL
ncbi:MAG: hypothetical protein ACOVRN_10360 [Flavobacterium sp.]